MPSNTKANGRVGGRFLFCVLASDVRPKRELPNQLIQALTGVA